MKSQIKLVSTDMDGTFLRDDRTFDIPRFKRIFSKIKDTGCNFVVSSGNQYYQLREFFPGYDEEMSFNAENGALVKDHSELIFAAEVPWETVEFVFNICSEYPDISTLICGLNSAYVQRGRATQEIFDLLKIYCRRLEWINSLDDIDDQILKLSLATPVEKTDLYYEILRERLNGKLVATTSGYGFIDLIIPGCHKASGLKRLVERWNITPEQCLAFGDSGNDIEMLRYCGLSYAMENASQNVKEVAKFTCPSNNDDGVLTILEEIFD